MTDREAAGARAAAGSDTPCRARRFAAGENPAKRGQILDGAHRVFSRMGFDAAGMADITREAGVSKGTIYVYFDGKDELFEALIERERERMFRDVAASLEVGGTTAERLRSFGRTLARLLCSQTVIDAHRVVIGIAGRKPDIGARFYARGALRGGALLEDFLTGAVAGGRLRPCDTHLAAQQFIELCLTGLFRSRLLGFMPDPPDEARISANVEAALAVFLAAHGVPAAG